MDPIASTSTFEDLKPDKVTEVDRAQLQKRLQILKVEEKGLQKILIELNSQERKLTLEKMRLDEMTKRRIKKE
ncbi:unnamed protein product [Bursaphelenchus okinawaensis]|uniref:Uncharacterized protein n=1 Tax=Bursaphelenchus okinawaensis TaxID=465554 RepID=A0A811JRY2_9BILA|nr:unnamed protein product [Bursaphelenchus okinawaensis]CAG9080353.1 unnamed protein product [Bursaphelenchus okinawaensis]